MSIYVLKEYVEKCIALGKEATFEGLKKYYSNKSRNKKIYKAYNWNL